MDWIGPGAAGRHRSRADSVAGVVIRRGGGGAGAGNEPRVGERGGGRGGGVRTGRLAVREWGAAPCPRGGGHWRASQLGMSWWVNDSEHEWRRKITKKQGSSRGKRWRRRRECVSELTWLDGQRQRPRTFRFFSFFLKFLFLSFFKFALQPRLRGWALRFFKTKTRRTMLVDGGREREREGEGSDLQITGERESDGRFPEFRCPFLQFSIYSILNLNDRLFTLQV